MEPSDSNINLQDGLRSDSERRNPSPLVSSSCIIHGSITSNSSSSQNSLDQRLCRFSSVRARGAHSSSLSSDPDSNARPRRTSLPFLLTGSLTFSPIVVLATTCALLSPLRVRQPDTLAAAALVVVVVIMCLSPSVPARRRGRRVVRLARWFVPLSRARVVSHPSVCTFARRRVRATSVDSHEVSVRFLCRTS